MVMENHFGMPTYTSNVPQGYPWASHHYTCDGIKINSRLQGDSTETKQFGKQFLFNFKPMMNPFIDAVIHHNIIKC